MLARRYFPLPGSFSMILGSIGLASGLPTLWYKRRCRKFPRLSIFLRRHRSQILVETLLRLLAPSMWCLAAAVTYGKHRESSTSSVISVCMLALLQDIELGKGLRILPLACNFAWF